MASSGSGTTTPAVEAAQKTLEQNLFALLQDPQ
jgi:hypothetical protein